MSKEDEKEWICICKLDNGDILEYDMAVSLDYWKTHSLEIDLTKWRYLREGVLYSVDGVLQKGKRSKTKYWIRA